MATVYIGIGSNLGNRQSNCEESVRRIRELKDVKVTAVSSFYETSPVGGPPQPMYINGVICLETETCPAELLAELKNIEKIMGRSFTGLRDLPRTIDLDILIYENSVIKTKELEVPHPRMHERYFVLKGLAEVAPDIIHPVFKKTAGELLRKIEKDACF
jgi:2-amino-4-hydroxy-6-hydroxymethyldihydropteridine diphosphokinase